MSDVKKKKSGNAGVVWAIRGVVFGTLIVLVVLAAKDHFARKNAENTARIWREKFKAGEKNNKPVMLKEFEEIAEDGWTRSEGKDKNRDKVFIYSWDRLFGEDMKIHLEVIKVDFEKIEDKAHVWVVDPQWGKDAAD